MNAKQKIIIPDFVFINGYRGVFDGFDRGCYPFDGVERPRWLVQMGLFDLEGNYFRIEIDTRKTKIKENVTYVLGGKAFYHPIGGFWTIGGKVNPQNGHMTSCKCKECNP